MAVMGHTAPHGLGAIDPLGNPCQIPERLAHNHTDKGPSWHLFSLLPASSLLPCGFCTKLWNTEDCAVAH